MIADSGISVTLVSSPGEELDFISRLYSMPVYPITMARRVSFLQDVGSLYHLVRYFKSQTFDIVHSTTPKAGLLTAIAGRLAQVPVRLHTFTGQPWVELSGPTRWAARANDRWIAWLNTRCYADSQSQRDFLIGEGLVHPPSISVLAHGSISGVDLARFDPSVWRGKEAVATRRELGIAEDALVVLFVGRITRDKGIVELITAFHSLDLPAQDVHLVLVGPFEPHHDPLPQLVLNEITCHPRIHATGFTRKPEKYMGIADVFCLPSYREGFGTVVIEAAAMGVPAVATSIVGLVDAVLAGETGLLVPPKDCGALCDALSTMLNDTGLRSWMARSAQARASLMFDAALVDQAVVDEYERVYAEHR